MCEKCIVQSARPFMKNCKDDFQFSEAKYEETDDPNDGYFDNHEYEVARRNEAYIKEKWKDV